MDPFVIDRSRPPAELRYRDAERALVLRPWRLTDCDALLAAVDASATELKAYMPWAHLPRTREDEYALVAGFMANYWAGREYVIGCFQEDGTILGGAGLHPRTALNPRALELGYWCHSAHAGRGWTTLAGKVLLALAFDRFGCDRFQLIHAEANVASRRIAEKLGMRYEGTLRGLSAAVPDALVAAGYRGTGVHRQYALFPDDLAALPWIEHVRAHTTYVDALGGVHAPAAR